MFAKLPLDPTCFARIYFFYTAGSRNRFEGMEAVCRHTKKHKTISKKHVFLIEKCFEDARQDEKHVPDLLESIMRPTDPVKEELREKLFKMTQFGSKIKKIRVCTFQMSGKIPDSANVAFEAPLFAIFGPARGQIYKKTAKKYKKSAGFSLKGWLPLLGLHKSGGRR